MLKKYDIENDIPSGRISMETVKTDGLEQEYNELTRDIEEIREKRDEHNQITKDLISMIKATNSKIKGHLRKASEHREKRDMYNDLVQQAKNNRVTTQIALEELRKRLNEIKEKYKDIRPINREQKIQIRRLKNAVHARNMEIETKPGLTTGDEDRLIKEIEELEGKLSDLTKGTAAKEEYSKVIAQFPKYRALLRKYHQEVIDNSEESQKNHELMINEYNQVDKLREKNNDLEKSLNENRKKADQFHDKLLGFYKRRDELRQQIGITQRNNRKRRQKERHDVSLLKRRLAKERLEKGEKLDFIEFRLLLEKNEIVEFKVDA
ncbi:MAG: coiled-coil protein [Promethearchaeota archaeon]